jgi:Uma2 family endonuclease
VKRGRVEGPPDLAIEIVSPDSVERDYEKKFEKYRQAGVGEYWIIDEVQETAHFYRRNRRGEFREVRLKEGAFHSQVLPGFRLRPEWLWQYPRPDRIALIQQFLGSEGTA